ncbi:hypothetical protein WKI68_14365 [Streptomyces sp. MS1.HAVA.3]|uniref:Transposase n=1 Tax=Streptomyces caledonius TaxID=3134107 RepID=A0ABU8U348_9ACTN
MADAIGVSSSSVRSRAGDRENLSGGNKNWPVIGHEIRAGRFPAAPLGVSCP